MPNIRPVIVGCRKTNYSEEELQAFKELQPFGLLVFNEACAEGKEGLKRVIRQFKEAVGREDTPVLIDNEGGKVWRMKPEYDDTWYRAPSANDLFHLYQKDPEKAKKAAQLSGQITATQMLECGVNVNCAPVIDVLSDDTFDEGTVPEDAEMHATSADMVSRCYGEDVDTVTELAWHFADGMMKLGVTPIIKHMPGLGRMKADPHYLECRIDHTIEQLDQKDFESFRRLKNIPVGMTSHGIYTAIDSENSATLSKKVIQEIIRERIGFNGVLVADTLEMNAVWPEGFDQSKKDRFGMGLPKEGTMAKLTKEALEAGCDIILHSDCSGNFDYIREILEAAGTVSDEQYQHLLKMNLKPTLEAVNENELKTTLNALLVA